MSRRGGRRKIEIVARQIAIETGQQERGERVLSSSSLLFFFFFFLFVREVFRMRGRLY